MTDIVVPKLNANDPTYTVVEWLVPDGQEVRAGTPVVVLETSKATHELTVDGGGYLRHLLPVDADCAAGQVVGRVVTTVREQGRTAPDGPQDPTAQPAATDVTITGPAALLAAEHGIAPERLRGLGPRVVRRTDVLALLATDVEPAREVLPMPRAQAAVADVVARSHARIPPGFSVIKVTVDGAMAYARTAGRRYGTLIGLPELTVQAIAALRPAFPACFGALRDDGTVTVADGADVGVSIDVGTGLFVPVVPGADRLGLGEIGALLLQHRLTALRSTFRAGQLSGANIMLTLSNDEILFSQPIVFPGQVCAVSLGATTTELRLDPDGGVRRSHVVHVGLAYDHRVINGAGAAEFLKGLKRLLETAGSDHAGTG